MPSPTRRGFLMGCSAAIANLAAARFTSVVFADPGTTPDHEVLVVLFLRGGMDGLNYVLPLAGVDRPHYLAARPTIAVPDTGANAALPLAEMSGTLLGLHPGAAPLHELWQDGRVAFVHACGLATPSRSHFDNQAQIELGTPGVGSTTTGWLTRHFLSASLPPGIVMPSLAVSSTIQTAFQASTEAIAMTNRDDFVLNTGPSTWRDAQKTALRNILESSGDYLHSRGVEALDASTLIELNVPSGTYVPANGAIYPSGAFGDAMKLIAQMIKLGMGLRAVTVDLGGWDTHNGQGSAGAGTYFHNQVNQLAQGLHGFYTDLDGASSENYTSKTTVAVMSEFGRRVAQNADSGTDHGHGGVMTILGGRVNGGLYGEWPGLDLAGGQLYDNADLAITTDFRTVLAELLVERLGNPDVGFVFPGFSYPGPLGFATLFRDGFESGGAGRWSAMTP